MASKPYQFPADVQNKNSAFNSKFSTPKLPPVEELQLLKTWELVLELIDFEAEVLENYGPSINFLDLIEEKKIDKEGANLVNAVRRELALIASRYPSKKDVKIRKRNPSKANLRSRIALSVEELNISSADWFRSAIWYAVKDDHPDEILSRFLSQQEWDPERGFARFSAAIRWRATERHTDDLLRSGEEGAQIAATESNTEVERQVAGGFFRQIEMGQAFIRGHDWEGRPVVIMRLRLHHPTAQPMESMKRFIIFQIETARLMLGPAILDAVQLYDYTDAKINNHDLVLSKFMIELFNLYYPKTLRFLIIHKASKVMYSAFQVVKGLLSAETAAKVRFTQTVEDLEKYIPRANIIKGLGGDDDWEYKYEPVQPGENRLVKDCPQKRALLKERRRIWIEFENLTRAMIKTAQSGLDYSSIKAQRDECVDRMRAAYWMLDPFIRAKTHYDRIGAISFRRESALLAVELTYGQNLKRLSKQVAEHSIEESSDQDQSSDRQSSTTTEDDSEPC